MAWRSLGTVNLSYDWKLFPDADFNGRIFRLTQTYAVEPTGKAYLTFFYPEGKFGFKSFFPETTRRTIILLPVPQELQDAGIISRFPAVRIAPRTRVYGLDWNVTVEVQVIA